MDFLENWKTFLRKGTMLLNNSCEFNYSVQICCTNNCELWTSFIGERIELFRGYKWSINSHYKKSSCFKAFFISNNFPFSLVILKRERLDILNHCRYKDTLMDFHFLTLCLLVQALLWPSNTLNHLSKKFNFCRWNKTFLYC